MRRVLTALAMIAACVFIAAPAIAQDDTVPADPGSSSESTPEETPPSEEELPPTEGPPTPSVSEEPEAEPEKALKKLANDEVGALAQDPDNVKRITICHRRAANSNPYGPKAITVSANSIVKNNGHDSHDGPVWPATDPQTGQWGDIIPSFFYGENGENFYPGQNLPVGQAFLDNNCQVPGEEDDDGVDDGDDGDDGDDSDDGDDGDDSDGDDEDKGSLPDTGGGSPWILLTGGLLSVLGLAILSNGALSREQVVGRHVKM